MIATSAVLTGDFIDSAAGGEKKLLMAMTALQGAAAAADAAFGRYRGDGWQMYLRNSDRTLSLIIHILAALRAGKSGLATRIAVGVGTANLPGSDIAEGSGAAFELSGRGLDSMPARQQVAIAGLGVMPLHGAILALCNQIAGGWSQAQARAIREAMPPWSSGQWPTHQEVASRLGITRQATQERLARAGYNAVVTAITAWEADDD